MARRPSSRSLSTHEKVWKILAVVFLLLTAFFALCFYFENLFITFILGGALILFAERMQNIFHKGTRNVKSKWRRRLYGSATFLLCLLAVMYLVSGSIEEMASALSQVNSEGNPLVEWYADNIQPYIPQFVQKNVITADSINKAQVYVLTSFSAFISNLGALILNAVLIIPLMFWMYFKRGDAIHARIRQLIPRKFHKGFENGHKDISKQLHEFFDAKALESLVIGVICCVGFYLAGLKGWLLLGLFAGFLNIVPYIGPVLGAIPPLVMAFLTVGPLSALYVVITIIVGQLVDNLYLIPFMISGKVQVDALLSIILILVGAQLFGALGMIFAIPIYLVYKIVLRECYEELVKIYGR